MYSVKPMPGLVAVAAFLVAVVASGVDAGALKDKKLLVDTKFNMVDDNDDKVNDSANTIAPSMAMAGDTIKVELFIEDGGGVDVIGGQVEFADRKMDMKFDDSWRIVAVDGIVGALGVSDDGFTLGTLSAVTIGDNGYFATVKILSKVNIADGASFYARSAIVTTVVGGLANWESDSLDVSEAVITIGQQKQLLLDAQIESPPRNNNALTLPEKKPGDTIRFQLFVPEASGTQIQGYTVEPALKGKTFGSYVDNVSGTDLNGGALISRASGSGNPTLSMLSLSAVTVPSTGYLGQVTLNVSRALTSSDVLAVQTASTAGPGGVQNLDVSNASLSFSQAAACPGDFDGDGTVSLADFLAFAGAFGTRSGDANYNVRADLDGNGAVDLSDFLAFAGVFGTKC